MQFVGTEFESGEQVAGHGLRKDTPVRVITWNLFHGRSVPETPRSLLPEFAAALASWDWDVALLQEVPPWWPRELAIASGADHARTALTSRNQLLPLRRLVAERRPDVIKSGGGGANAILLRVTAGTLAGHRRHTLTRRPERRVAHAVALRGGTAGALTGSTDVPLWIGNLHASQAEPLSRARADGATAVAWLAGVAGQAPWILGGDFNDRAPFHPPLRAAASRSVDHVLVPPWMTTVTKAHTLRRARSLDGITRRLSDHPPLAVTLRRAESADAPGLGSP
jgi:endonuclease/exonuclease/phosphatase family metal-dependent hydrolase